MTDSTKTFDEVREIIKRTAMPEPHRITFSEATQLVLETVQSEMLIKENERLNLIASHIVHKLEVAKARDAGFNEGIEMARTKVANADNSMMDQTKLSSYISTLKRT